LAFAYTMGAIVSGWGGAAERAIEWGEQALRLSPLDPHAFGAWHGLGLGFFTQGRYEEAANAERRAIQRNPGFSVLHLMLAAALVKLGRIDEAKAAAARLLARSSTASEPPSGSQQPNPHPRSPFR
jgi:adenylate cyclase